MAHYRKFFFLQFAILVAKLQKLNLKSDFRLSQEETNIFFTEGKISKFAVRLKVDATS